MYGRVDAATHDDLKVATCGDAQNASHLGLAKTIHTRDDRILHGYNMGFRYLALKPITQYLTAALIIFSADYLLFVSVEASKRPEPYIPKS